MATLYPPYIIERSSRGERTYDIFSRLLMDRIVFLGAPINDDVANIIIAQLLFLDADNPERDIWLYINSPGGIISSGMGNYDIFSRLLMDRIVFLGAPINDDVANIIIAQLLFLDADNPERDIWLYINSPGGIISSGMAIYDTLQFLRAPVNT